MTCRAVLQERRKEQEHVCTTRVLQLNFLLVFLTVFIIIQEEKENKKEKYKIL